MSWRNWRLESVCGPIRWKNNQGIYAVRCRDMAAKTNIPSFSVYALTGQFTCHKENIKGGPLKLAELTGHPLPDDDRVRRSTNSRQQIDKLYDYTDATGQLIYQAVRLRPKGFTSGGPTPRAPGNG